MTSTEPTKADPSKTELSKAEVSKAELSKAGPSKAQPKKLDPTDKDLTKPGTAADVLRITAFRRIFLASFASAIGRWMQNVALGVFAFKLSGNATFTTLVVFAQLVPMLMLSLVGGSLADTVDRRMLLLVTQGWQTFWTLILAWQVIDGQISRELLLAIVFLIGLGQAIFAPTFGAVIPGLVGRENLGAAISLNSASMNGARVVGPAIGGLLVPWAGVATVFFINAATYAIIIAVLFISKIPNAKRSGVLSASDRFLGGLRLARLAPQVGRPLLIMVAFVLFCLPFIGLMPVIADINWGIDTESSTYGWIYAAFGMGALIGAASAGTVLLHASKPLLVRLSLGGFALSLASLSLVRGPALASVGLFFVGFFYFILPVTLSTFIQQHLHDEVRGRVMALWTLSFGGVVSLTNLWSGWFTDQTSPTTTMLLSATVAALLALTGRIRPGDIVGERLLDAHKAAKHAT